MSLPSLCIKRPVFTTMLIALPMVLGIITLRGIGVELFPNVEFPLVMITTSRPGASVEEMETGVTKPIEEVVNTISDIDELKSTTTEGLSMVVVSFQLSKDRDVAMQEVQSKINTILASLPTGTNTPIIDKFDIDSAPVMSIAVSGRRSMREITEIADKQIKDSLSSLYGVGAVNLIGGRKRAINVTVDVQKLESYNLSIEQVRQALMSQNLELPGGRVDQGRSELVLRTVGRIEDPRQFAQIIVANVGGQPVRIRDLGDAQAVVDSNEEARSLARLDGNNAVSLVVQKQSGTNTVQVIQTVKERLAKLRAAFDQGGKGDIRMEVIRDQSRFIEGSLHEVQKHLWLGAMLVILTILLFLRDWRTTVIASIAIPASLLAAFPAMKIFGLTLNNITLVALTLVIGIVIDDAVIVIENIFRWMEEHRLTPRQAALKGTAEITLAVVATTMSLTVIFIPIAFMPYIVGRFLRSFGITCAITILASLLVSMTLTPMLCSRFMKLSKKIAEGGKHGGSHHSGGFFGHAVEQPYLWTLRWAMRHRWVIVLAAIVTTASIFPLPVGRWVGVSDPKAQRWLNYPGLLAMTGFDFVPKDDQSEFEIAIQTPEGWTLEKTDGVFRQIEGRLKGWREITNVMTQIGDTSGRQAKGEGSVTRGTIYVRLIDLKERRPPFTQFDMMGQARQLLREYPDLRTSVQMPANMTGGGANADVEFILTGPDLARLGSYAERMIEKLRATPGLVDVDTTMALRKPELRVVPDRDRASDLGVSIQAVASTLRTLVGGQIVSDYKDNQVGEQYDVWLRARGVDRDNPQAVLNMTVPSSKAPLVRLASVATPVEALGPSQIDRSQRMRKISIIANLSGLPTGTAAVAFQDAFKALDAPPDYSLIATGRAKGQAEAGSAFIASFALSLLFMYMVLAAQFESFVHPITILLAVPLTIPFALLSLIFLGQPLSLFSILGLFLLFGIVKKNGILQVDYTNVLRRRVAENPESAGELFAQAQAEIAARPSSWQRWMLSLPDQKRTRLWAILEANRVRLRPILMTTLMLISAMIPIALGKGPGAAVRGDMAKVIVGGQALSLLLSLLVTPVAYSLFDDLSLLFRRRPRPVVPVEEEESAATAGK